ncbi:hypothetical protein GCM10027019_23630 [Melaminivora jejuensis]
MQRLQAFKYELRPDGQQARQMVRFAGSCRFVFNKALALHKERYERGEKKLGYAALCKLLTEWRGQADLDWGNADCRAAAQHQQNLPRVWLRERGQPQNAGRVQVRRMRARRPCRSHRRDQHTEAGTPRSSLWRGRQPRKARKGQACSLGEAGTR